MKLVFIYIIKIYQNSIGVFLRGSCRFHPTCSEYMKGAIEKYGVFKGGFLATKRILRCNPWGGSGVDNLPGEK